MSHVIPVKKNKENDFSMEFSTGSKSREIDRSERFYRIMRIFGAAFDATSPPFLSPFKSFCCLSNVLVLGKSIR